MIFDDVADFAIEFFLFLQVLVVNFIEVVPAGAVSLVGQSHFHFPSFLFEGERTNYVRS